jgi:hypothetical protein
VSRVGRRPRPSTLELVGLRGFLALGSGIGAVGWTGTALLAARPDLVASPVPISAALWALLVALMVSVGVFLTPDAVRFSRPMLVWGPVNAVATLLTLAALVGVLSGGWVPAVWALAGAVGYAASARFVGRGVYTVAALLELGTLGAALLGVPSPVLYALLGVCHALTLALIVAEVESARASAVIVVAWLAVLLVGVGL